MKLSGACVLGALLFGCRPSGPPVPSAPEPAPPAAMPAPEPASAPEPHWLDERVALAVATTGTPATRGLPMLVLSTRELRLIGDDAFTLAVPAESDWERGFPADQKRSGANDLYVTPLAGWLGHAADGEKDITLVVDRRIPFRVLVEVMFTASQSGYARFHLVVEDRGGFGEILVEVPERSGLPSGVTLLVVRDGVAIKSAKGNVAPGCAGVGVGIAIPRRGSEHDRAALASCLANLAQGDANLRGSVISANPGTPFQEIVMALDAVRSVPALAAAAFGVPK